MKDVTCSDHTCTCFPRSWGSSHGIVMHTMWSGSDVNSAVASVSSSSLLFICWLWARKSPDFQQTPARHIRKGSSKYLEGLISCPDPPPGVRVTIVGYMRLLLSVLGRLRNPRTGLAGRVGGDRQSWELCVASRSLLRLRSGPMFGVKLAQVHQHSVPFSAAVNTALSRLYWQLSRNDVVGNRSCFRTTITKSWPRNVHAVYKPSSTHTSFYFPYTSFNQSITPE